MRPIGFSTGALAKGDFRLGIQLQRAIGGVTVIELSALREAELRPLLDAISTLQIDDFAYVSVHAPSKLSQLDEREVFWLLSSLPSGWPIVVHPEIMRTPALWRSLGSRLCIENMDNRKTTGRTPGELRELFSAFPEAGFCLDVGHARQMDPTMSTAIQMLNEFRPRLRQLHVSEVGGRGEHRALSESSREAFRRVAEYVPATCPLIIESVIERADMVREIAAVVDAFDVAPTMRHPVATHA